jgi:S1-C subfamily serine protease
MRSRLIGLSILAGLTVGILTRPAPQPTQQGIADQVAEVRSTVVHVARKGVCQGSGCVISSDGIVFTAKHVVEDEPNPAQYIVTLDNGTKCPVRYVLTDTRYDVAFLLLDHDPNLPAARLADYASMRVGDPVFIMGSPLGFDNFNSVSLGILSAMQRDLDATRPGGYGLGWQVTFQSTSPAFPGNSGGPVFRMDGSVIGVLVAGMDATLNYSVPVAVFADQIDVVREAFALMRFKVPDPPVYDGAGYRTQHSWEP